jgi:ligand-binding SRPBCC domain-containing protein
MRGSASVIRIETEIHATPVRCFDLARNVEVHVASTAGTRERAVAGVTTGLLGHGDTVTWEAVHLGVKQRFTSRITRFEPPHLFEDEMVRGAFHSFTHLHEFRPFDAGTLMVDTVQYVAPLGILGRLANALFLKRYLRHFLKARADALKAMAEAPENVSSYP